MKNEIRIEITESGESEIDLTRVQGSVEDLKRLLKDLTGELGPIMKERHEPGLHHHHDGLHEHMTGGVGRSAPRTARRRPFSDLRGSDSVVRSGSLDDGVNHCVKAAD